jgi:basic amino acid/polyamine antiporter, APA family
MSSFYTIFSSSFHPNPKLSAISVGLPLLNIFLEFFIRSPRRSCSLHVLLILAENHPFSPAYTSAILNDLLKMKNKILPRQMGLMGLIATGVCAMMGASINVLPFMIQRHVPGIGPYVIPAFLLAAIPALLAAFAYAILSTAMPRAGGSYLYASRGLHPFLGFVGSFSQWFGLSVVIGVVAYLTVPFLRDIAAALGWADISLLLDQGLVRVGIALGLLWTFVFVNIRGTVLYEKTLIPLMLLMFLLGGIVIVAGFSFTQSDFMATQPEGRVNTTAAFHWPTFLSAGALLFASFIGFDSIAQAGGEAKDPQKKLPLAIALTITIVGGYYILFTSAVYHTVPWQYVADAAQSQDITAPGLLAQLLPNTLTVLIISGAAIALINDLPAMLLSVSRLMFAWAEDRIFPSGVSKLHPKYNTPVPALLISGCMASIGILGSHYAESFFLGIDIMVTAMMVNFLLMCITLLTIDRINPALAARITFVKNKKVRLLLGWSGTLVITGFLIIHTWKDLQAEVGHWYFHSTPVYLLVMLLASAIYLYRYQLLQKANLDLVSHFKNLPYSSND